MTSRLDNQTIEAFLAMARDRDKIVDANSPLSGLFSIMESALHELQRRRSWEQRSPEFDGTDGADSAWWRGHDAGIAAACTVWQQALTVDPEEVVSSPRQYGSAALTERFVETVKLRTRPLIVGSRVISEPGAGITLTEFELSATAKEGLKIK